MRSTITAQPGLHNLYRTGSGGATILVAGFVTAFAAAGFAVRFAVRFTSRVRRAAARVRVALMVLAPPADSAITSRDLRFLLALPWALSFRIAPRLSESFSFPQNFRTENSSPSSDLCHQPSVLLR